MSKGLDALEKIKQAEYFVDFEQDAKIKDDYKAELTIIETALKRLETLEEEKQSFDKQLEKKLKALEIIKNKEINVHALFLHLKRFDKPDGYNVLVGTKYQITQEEYDILKEELL